MDSFLCEIMERNIYLRNTQNHLKITNCSRNKSFLEFYLVFNGVCLKLLGTLNLDVQSAEDFQIWMIYCPIILSTKFWRVFD